MPVDRPTFSESWYRVAALKPRLRATVQVYRQHFRGQMWHVVQDPSSNQFFRLNDAAYRYVALLDGNRTVAQVWNICNEQLGDGAPTQGEVIQLLGQLYTSNLLQAEMTPDTEGLFNRYQKRVSRELKGYLSNLMFVRIPLFDPDRILDEFLPAVRWIFTPFGFLIWLIMICVGGYFVIGRSSELISRATNVLDPSNLPLLFIAFWLVKIFHEFGHGFACKKFGKDAGTGGEVHTMGVMLLVFTPLPYVDASSAWAYRRKLHRMIVGMAGMIIELGIAAIAAIIWALTSPGTLHSIMYNVMFVASVSTLLFNANPLLRYDGYYILSDILEIPNLSNRSKDYLKYLVRRYAWGVRRARNPAHSRGEKIWFVSYGLASTVYRFFIVTAILLFIASKLFFIGVILALAALAAWLLTPLGKLLKYLATSNELARVRLRAILTTAGTFIIVVGLIALVPAPDRSKIEGVVEPEQFAFVQPRADGFIKEFTPSQRDVTTEEVLFRSENPELQARLKMLQAEKRSLEARKRRADTESIAAAQSLAKALDAIDKRLASVQEEIDSLSLRPPFAGYWISPNIDRLSGAYVKRGQQLGLIASRQLRIIAVAQQDISNQAFEEISKGQKVDIRVKGRPDLELQGTITHRIPAGQKFLPSKALGYAVGGSIQTSAEDQEGVKSQEPFFALYIAPDSDSDVDLMVGQRVVVRLSAHRKPLLSQWWRAIRQLVQRRFHS